MTSEEYLKKYTVGALSPLPTAIQIVAYDPDWPRRFELAAGAIRKALGERALRIEHAGSTSVPGLPAKPAIDIVLEVADSSRESAYLEALETAGFSLRIREPEWFEHRMFETPQKDVNLHVFSAGCPEVEKMLTFRDWLRANADDRDLYARTKQELATQDWKYIQHYADAKTAVIEEILARAARA